MPLPLIPLETFFGNPTFAQPALSPDGRAIVYLAPLEGVMNAWVRPVSGGEARPLTFDRKRGIPMAWWAMNGEQVMFMRDADGDENFHLFAVPASGGDAVDLTPFDGAKANLIGRHPDFPDEILVAVNDRDRRLFDAWRIDTRTGRRTLEVLNDIGASALNSDQRLCVRLASVATPDGGKVLRHRDGQGAPWTDLLTFPSEDALGSGVIGFADDHRTAWVVSSHGAETLELRALDTGSGRQTVIASDPEADVEHVIRHPRTGAIRAVAFDRDRLAWKAVDPSVAADYETLPGVNAGDFAVIGQSIEDRTWLVAFEQDRGSAAYYLWDRAAQRASLLGYARPELEGLPLAEMKPVRFPARDGLPLRGYLSVPRDAEPRALPAVLLVHGGPWHRDSWGWQPQVQWLANRGYAVLQVNFRGSPGFGKRFLNAANREWGGRMQDDLTDAVRWLVAQGVADPKRVGIYGGSYGGYAALAGMTFTPELFACGVAICGPSNLISFVKTVPPYWTTMLSMMHHRIGNPDLDADFLKSRSPLFHIDRLRAPLLVGQGANDPRVVRAESLQMVEALRSAGKEVEYIEFADEGHGFARPENRMTFQRAAEKFLAKHLGGRAASD
ncbi:MAG: dipeptidyl aminopeptidase/acylaminoacyl [Planctomycetota bacterium]|nr:MAG: dipeptidyl aminopeptidase/acylaminoacyl [Planctomycetota bacterium]